MTLHTLDSLPGSLLGKVNHYVTRFEVQHPGSLHAHIVSGCDPATVDSAAFQTSASVPAAKG